MKTVQPADKKVVKVFIAEENDIFKEGLTGLLHDEKDIEVAGTAQDPSQIIDVARDNFRNADVLILSSGFFGQADLPEMIKDIKLNSPQIKILLILKDTVSDEVLMPLLTFGVEGYIKKSVESNVLKNALRTLQEGGLWVERDLLNKFVKSPPLISGVESRLSMLAEPLTEREKEIVSLLLQGLSNSSIADRLFISEKTVKTHLGNVFKKMDVKSRAQLIASLVRS